MRLVRFGSKIVNMDLVTDISIWDNADGSEANIYTVASGNEGQSYRRLKGADVIALECWLEDNCENARAPMEDDPDSMRPRDTTGFGSLRGMVYTACPCGCGTTDICDAQRARVAAANAAIPF